mgnify:FL=1
MTVKIIEEDTYYLRNEVCNVNTIKCQLFTVSLQNITIKRPLPLLFVTV